MHAIVKLLVFLVFCSFSCIGLIGEAQARNCVDQAFQNNLKERFKERKRHELLFDLLHIQRRIGFGPSKMQPELHPEILLSSGISREKLMGRIILAICDAIETDSLENDQVETVLRKSYPDFANRSQQEIIKLRYKEKQKQRILPTLEKPYSIRDSYFLFLRKAYEFSIAKILARGIYSKGIPLRTKLSVFWLNHFSVNALKGGQDFLLPFYFDSIIASQEGSPDFVDMLQLASMHPVMLRYLDNADNRHPELNLNFSRELLELHSLGARPTEMVYSQKDVESVAKVLSGHTLKVKNGRPQYVFDSTVHSEGKKQIFGKSISSGEKGALELLELLASRPETKRHICTKLQLLFFDSAEDIALRDLCIDKWGSRGNLVAIYKAFLTSPQFWNPKYYSNGWKRPMEAVISLLRNIEIKDFAIVTHFAASYFMQVNQALGRFPNPTGYPLQSDEWNTSLNLKSWTIFRGNLRKRLRQNEISRLSGLNQGRMDSKRIFTIGNFLDINSPLFLLK